MSMEKSIFAQLTAILEDHLKLATLESRYEIQHLRQRLLAFAFVFTLGLAAFLLAQVAVIYGLVTLGLTIWVACLSMSAVYAIGGILVFMKWGRRNREAGPAFSGTRREIGATLQWIQKLFS